jgi:signal transduction histidine kinase
VKFQIKNNRNYLAFYVYDTGIGIKEEDQKGLFKLFGMISSKNKLNPNGCGIGLTVSRKYIEHLGGEIEFHSTFNVGTKVKILVPFIKPSIQDVMQNMESLEDVAIEDESKVSASII